MKGSEVEISFFVDDEKYALRFWPQVPRVGDEVMLGAGQKFKDQADRWGKVPFRVKRVIWGTEAPNASAHDRQCVNVEIELIDDMKEKP